MKKMIIIIPFFTSLLASSWKDKLEEARRLCINDSIPQAIENLTAAIKEERSEQAKFYLWLETGDILFQYAKDYSSAKAIYSSMISYYKGKPEFLKWLYYRLGLTCERLEDYLNAAGAYERQAINFLGSPLHDDALVAIERCFKKNYREKVGVVNGCSITSVELEEKLQQMPEKKRKELIEEMILDYLIFKESEKRIAPKETSVVHIYLKDTIKEFKLPLYLEKPKIIKRIEDLEYNDLARRLYEEEVISKIKVKEEDIKRYYKENKEKFKIPERVRYKEILIKDTTKVDSVILALKSLPFDSVAKLYSETPQIAPIIKERDKGTLPPEIVNALSSLKPGEISDTVHTKRGVVILKLEENIPAEFRKFKDVRSTIERMLKDEYTKERAEKVMQAYKKEAKIDTTERGDTVAIVNGYLILKEDIEEQLKEIPEFARPSYDTPEGRKKLLDNLIFKRVLQYQIIKNKVFMNDTIQQLLWDRRKEMLKGWLEEEEIHNKVQVSEEEKKEYYQNNKKEFWVPSKVKVKRMIFTSEDSAKKVYKLLKKGLPFDSLAKEYSEEEDTKRDRYVEFIEEGQEKYLYQKEAFKLKPGKLSKIIKEDGKFYIILVEEKKDAYQKKFEEVKTTIFFKLKSRKREELEAKLKGTLFSKADIKLFLEEKEE